MSFHPRWFVVLAAAFLCGLVASVSLRGAARALGIVNHPNPIVPQHTRAVAYLGGIAVAVAAAVVAGAFAAGRAWVTTHAGSVALPCVLMLVVGTVDDVRAFSPRTKFTLQALVAGVGVATGARYAFTHVEALDAALSWLWIVTLVNAFNLTDVCDGLVAGLSVIAFAAIGAMFPESRFLAATLAGATLGFLVLNLPRASMFLGDGGSHFLGALVATLLLAAPAGGGMRHPVSMLLVAGVPLFELVFLVVVRSRKGLDWWRGSPDHFSLRLQQQGLTRLQTDAVAWLAALALAGLAVASPRWMGEPIATGVVSVVLAACTWMAWRFLLRVEVRA